MTQERYEAYIRLLQSELVPAMGCTEPISIAYATALTRSLLGEEPLSGRLEVSANIVKNAKSVTVPQTGGLKGLSAAFAAGLFGDASKVLEVLSVIREEDLPALKKTAEEFPLEISVPEGCDVFDITVTLTSKDHTARVRIVREHTNVVLKEKDGEVLFSAAAEAEEVTRDKQELNVRDIVTFADTVELSRVLPILQRQVECNMAIAEEGLRGNWGAGIGQVLLRTFGPDIRVTAKAYAAAGSDARMNGCDMPVVINSGSGNQGITCSVPVVVYARGMKVPDEKMYRALCVSNLITLRLKAGIGTLSAYCGAVSAGAGAGCGVAYLQGGGYEEIAHTLVNAVAIDSGIICDGAKASCAAKIATAVEAGLLGFAMYQSGKEFFGGDGIVKKGVEATIDSVSRLADRGMRETDKEIIRIMLEE